MFTVNNYNDALEKFPRLSVYNYNTHTEWKVFTPKKFVHILVRCFHKKELNDVDLVTVWIEYNNQVMSEVFTPSSPEELVELIRSLNEKMDIKKGK